MTDYWRKGSVGINTGRQWLSDWSQKLDIDVICLFGGEPLMNQDIIEWIRQTRHFFPNSKIKIITNGFYLKNKNILKDLFDVGNVEYQISLHWRKGKQVDLIKKNILSQMQEFGRWAPIKSNRREILCSFVNKSVTLQLAVFGEFIKPYHGHGNSMKPWNSDDIQQSYNNCGSPRNPILYKNKIFKCGPIANLKDTLELNELLNDPDWFQYLSYEGFSLNDDLTELIDNFDKPNDICSMCSKNKTNAEIDHYASGSVIEKKKIKIWKNLSQQDVV